MLNSSLSPVRFSGRHQSCFTAVFLAAVALAACVSCSILENRSECPCTLYLDLSDSRNGVCDTLMVNVWSSGNFSETFSVPKDCYDRIQTVRVPSRHGAGVFVMDASVSSGYVSGPGGGITIPYGEQCPPVYMYSSYCITEEETCADTVKVCKNFCGVTLNFISSDMNLYDMEVTGIVNGYSSSGAPVRGEFAYSMAGSGVCYFKIPRQIDESLQLSVSIPGGREKVFAFGEYIVQSGYDWTKSDLDDIAVTIDYASTSLVVTIDGWSTTVEYDVVV